MVFQWMVLTTIAVNIENVSSCHIVVCNISIETDCRKCQTVKYGLPEVHVPNTDIKSDQAEKLSALDS